MCRHQENPLLSAIFKMIRRCHLLQTRSLDPEDNNRSTPFDMSMSSPILSSYNVHFKAKDVFYFIPVHLALCSSV